YAVRVVLEHVLDVLLTIGAGPVVRERDGQRYDPARNRQVLGRGDLLLQPLESSDQIGRGKLRAVIMNQNAPQRRNGLDEPPQTLALQFFVESKAAGVNRTVARHPPV